MLHKYFQINHINFNNYEFVWNWIIIKTINTLWCRYISNIYLFTHAQIAFNRIDYEILHLFYVELLLTIIIFTVFNNNITRNMILIILFVISMWFIYLNT